MAIPNNKAVIVAGMHRSGTSAVAGALEKCGVQFGSNLLPGKIGVNPKGYWEDREIIELHNEFLARKGKHWDDVLFTRENPGRPDENADAEFRSKLSATLRNNFSTTQLWGVKDPRICNFLPAWLETLSELATEPLFVIVIRSPYDVIASLQERNGFSKEKGAHLWLRHTLQAELHTRGHRRVLVDYALVLAEPLDQMARIIKSLALEGILVVPADIDSFLEPSLRHHNLHQPGMHDSGHWIWPVIDVAYSLFQKISRSGDPVEASEFDTIQQKLDEFEARIPDVIVEHLRMTGTNCYQTLLDLQLRIERMHSSLSWRLTSPFRKVLSKRSRLKRS